MSNLSAFCERFYKERGDHINSNWLTFRSLFKRVSYKPEKGDTLNTFMTNDVRFDSKFISLLKEEVSEGRITKDEIRSHILLLKNHKTRAGGRGEFTSYAVAIFGVMITLDPIFVDNIIGKTIVTSIAALFIFFAFAEKSMLNDSKAATEELINILEFQDA